MCILDIQGIKFTSRNFQIEIELKQVMALDNEPIFDNFLIKTKKTPNPLEEVNILQSLQEKTSTIVEDENNLEDKLVVEEPIIEEQKNINTLEEIEHFDLLQPDEPKEDENISLDINFEDLVEDIEENNDILKEISNDDLNLDNNDRLLTLKKPNQVYFELYKEARNKAKQAKKNAILAYLEAKNIKKTYMVENINDSDSDFDAEIDEASESELEGL
jgi:hypothetical protein